MWVASWIVALHWEEQDDGTAEQQEDEGEEDEIQLMWDNNIDNLKKAIGG